jgi:intein/homing endonuclease
MAVIVNENYLQIRKAYKTGKAAAVLEGGSRCFDGDQEIITLEGIKKIKDISENDLCKSYNHQTNEIEFKQVVALNKQKNTKKCFLIKLKDGTEIKVTKDHKFFFNNRYIEIENILSLLKK